MVWRARPQRLHACKGCKPHPRTRCCIVRTCTYIAELVHHFAIYCDGSRRAFVRSQRRLAGSCQLQNSVHRDQLHARAWTWLEFEHGSASWHANWSLSGAHVNLGRCDGCLLRADRTGPRRKRPVDFVQADLSRTAPSSHHSSGWALQAAMSNLLGLVGYGAVEDDDEEEDEEEERDENEEQQAQERVQAVQQQPAAGAERPSPTPAHTLPLKRPREGAVSAGSHALSDPGIFAPSACQVLCSSSDSALTHASTSASHCAFSAPDGNVIFGSRSKRSALACVHVYADLPTKAHTLGRHQQILWACTWSMAHDEQQIESCT